MNDTFTATSQDDLARFVTDNSNADVPRKLLATGGRTATAQVAEQIEAVEISTLKLDKVVDYPARDMTITVEAGIRIDQLVQLLKAENQQLPIDVAQSDQATLGGVLATNTSGTRRFGYGTMRDYVIGITAVDALGRQFHAGGRVVKNVAGYDLCKLMVGSRGTLAIVTQVTLKLRPQLDHTSFLWVTMSLPDIDAALDRLLRSETRPIALDLLNPTTAGQVVADSKLSLPTDEPVLCIGVDGMEHDIAWQIETLKTELADNKPCELHVVSGADSGRLLNSLTSFGAPVDGSPLAFHASLLPSRTVEFVRLATNAGISVQAHAGNGVVRGHLPNSVETANQAVALLAPLRGFVHGILAGTGTVPGSKGDFTVLDCRADWRSSVCRDREQTASTELMKKVKQSLDPRNLFPSSRAVSGS